MTASKSRFITNTGGLGRYSDELVWWSTRFLSRKINLQRSLTAKTLCQLFHKIYKDSHMTGATSHSGRRTFITKLADKGVGLRVLMALTGYKSIATTQRYIELNPTVMKAPVELI